MTYQTPEDFSPQGSFINWEGGELGASPPEGPSSSAWMISMADLVSLLLTFFVLLFALSGVEADRWDSVTDSLSTTLSTPEKEGEPLPLADKNIDRHRQQQAIGLSYLASLFEAIVAETPQLQMTLVDLQEDRLVLSLSGDDIFENDEITVTPMARQLLSSVGGILDGLSNEVGVAAHTTSMPEGGRVYKSNWEFSLARAAAVANIFKEVGVKKTFRVYGMANARFNDLPDLLPAERLLRARRVDVVILPSWRRGL